MSKCCDFHQDMVTPRIEIDFCVDRPSHEVTAVTAHQVVFFSILLDTELENEGVFAGQAFEIARVKLGQSDDDGTALSHIHDELGAVISGRPGDIQGRPLLSDSPLWSEKASSVEVLVFLEQVAVRDPEKLSRVSACYTKADESQSHTPSLPNL